MATLSERFVSEKRTQWVRLRRILLKIRRNSYPSLTEEEIEDFARLYRLTCADLAQARTLRLSPDVIAYLNNIVGQAHKYLYSFKPVRLSRFKSFFAEVLPEVIIRHRVFILLAALFFFLPYFITLIVCYSDPDRAGLLVSGDLLAKIAGSYKGDMFSHRGVGMSAFALTFYMQHNISIAFYSFAGGVFAGLGTIYFLVYNGITLGAISGYIMALGYGGNFMAFITAHSVMEFSGLVTAGAAGLLLGYSIIKATKFYKKDQLALEKHKIFHLIGAATLMFLCAAAVEGGISPLPLPYIFKLAIALGSLAFLVYYFGILPLKRKDGVNNI